MAYPPPATPEMLFHPERDTTYPFFANAVRRSFEAGAAGFSAVNAAWLADAALLAYHDGEYAKDTFSAAKLPDYTYLDHDGTQCHVGSNDHFAIVAFRGTQPDDWSDLLTDARCLPTAWTGEARVHHGFADAMAKVWEPPLPPPP